MRRTPTFDEVKDTDMYAAYRYKNITAPSVSPSTTSDTATNKTEHLNFARYAGAYTHPAYGHLELCSPSPDSFPVHSTQCSEALSQLSKVTESDFGQTHKVAPDLIAVLFNPLFNHLHLTYIPDSSGLNFTLSLFEVTHTPKNESEVVILPAGLAGLKFTGEFVFEENMTTMGDNGRPKGLALGGGSWISGEIGPAKGGNVWERAEVYFERLEGDVVTYACQCKSVLIVRQ